MASTCPFIRLLAKDTTGVLKQNIGALSMKCPHLSGSSSAAAAAASLTAADALLTSAAQLQSIKGCAGAASAGHPAQPCSGTSCG
jgi:hypothetical protein